MYVAAVGLFELSSLAVHEGFLVSCPPTEPYKRWNLKFQKAHELECLFAIEYTSDSKRSFARLLSCAPSLPLGLEQDRSCRGYVIP